MKNNTKIITVILSIFLLLAAFKAYAIGDVEQGLNNSGLRSVFGFSAGGLTGSRNLGDFIANVIRILLYFAGAIAVVFIIIGGYQYMTSGGNEESAEKGKKTLINALIGIIIIVLSYVAVSVIVNLVSSGRGFFG